ncbi:tyrosine-type recombinase/integrase [Arthrospiribacter ruber]|nr:tyrosine-type recombinase/integrase [Arthrospiribacter ruber]
MNQKHHKVRAILLNVSKVSQIGTINIVVYTYSIDGKKEITYFPTAIRIQKPKFNKGIVKGIKGSDSINNQIQEEILKVNDLIKKLEVQNIPITKETLNQSKEKNSYSFYTLVQLIEFSKQYKEDNNKNKNTNSYNSLILNVQELEKEQNKTFKISNINQKLINDLLTYWRKKGLKSSTQNNYLRHLKASFLVLYKNNIIDDSFNRLDYSLKVVESDLPTLLDSEIQVLLKSKLANTEEMARIKFLIQMMTGLRFSDLDQIIPKNIINNTINIFLEKNEVPVKIPVHNNLKILLNSVDFNVRDNLKININHFNTVIKKVFKKLELNRPIQTIEERDGLIITKNKPLNRVISSHAARRTAISILSELGLSIAEIQSITGHRDINSVVRYIKISDNHKIIKMNQYSEKFNIR